MRIVRGLFLKTVEVENIYGERGDYVDTEYVVSPSKSDFDLFYKNFARTHPLSPRSGESSGVFQDEKAVRASLDPYGTLFVWNPWSAVHEAFDISLDVKNPIHLWLAKTGVIVSDTDRNKRTSVKKVLLNNRLLNSYYGKNFPVVFYDY